MRHGLYATRRSSFARTIGIVIVCVLCLLVGSCFAIGNRADGLDINGSYHEPVGIFTLNQRDPDVCYEVVVGNVIWSIVLVETIVAPIYLVGWQILEPVPDENCPYRK